MEISIRKWKELSVKDRISYITAFVMIGSGILLAFLSFFLNQFDIATGILIYIGQCFVIGGGLIGANVYFRSKWLEFNSNAKKEIEEAVEKKIDVIIHDLFGSLVLNIYLCKRNLLYV